RRESHERPGAPGHAGRGRDRLRRRLLGARQPPGHRRPDDRQVRHHGPRPGGESHQLHPRAVGAFADRGREAVYSLRRVRGRLSRRAPAAGALLVHDRRQPPAASRAGAAGLHRMRLLRPRLSQPHSARLVLPQGKGTHPRAGGGKGARGARPATLRGTQRAPGARGTQAPRGPRPAEALRDQGGPGGDPPHGRARARQEGPGRVALEFERRESPYGRPPTDVGATMRQVLYALVPAALAYVWYFGTGFILNLFFAALFCVAGEAFMRRVRGKPVEEALLDFSALVTAALLTFSLPPLTPWWVTATAALFAIVVAKHLYGEIGRAS